MTSAEWLTLGVCGPKDGGPEESASESVPLVSEVTDLLGTGRSIGADPLAPIGRRSGISEAMYGPCEMVGVDLLSWL